MRLIGTAALALLSIASYLVTTAAIVELRRRAAYRRHRKAFANRPKGKITVIGRVFVDQAGNEHAYGFTVDCGGRIPAIGFGPDGEILSFGWTEQELIEVAKRRSEFED